MSVSQIECNRNILWCVFIVWMSSETVRMMWAASGQYIERISNLVFLKECWRKYYECGIIDDLVSPTESPETEW